VPTTFTVKVHEVAAASVAPDRLTLAEPLAAEIVPPPHVPVRPLGDDTVSPDGKTSVKPIPLSDRLLLGFESVKVKVVLPFNGTLAAPNAFAMVGGSFVGGGTLLDDPPQPAFHRRPRTTRVSNTEQGATWNLRVMSASFYSSLIFTIGPYLYLLIVVGLWQIIRL
jgi:hypothetical protein